MRVYKISVLDFTLLETMLSPSKSVLKMFFLLSRWEILYSSLEGISFVLFTDRKTYYVYVIYVYLYFQWTSHDRCWVCLFLIFKLTWQVVPVDELWRIWISGHMILDFDRYIYIWVRYRTNRQVIITYCHGYFRWVEPGSNLPFNCRMKLIALHSSPIYDGYSLFNISSYIYMIIDNIDKLIVS